MTLTVSEGLAAVAMLCVLGLISGPARAAGEFPFGMEMTLDASPLSGSKRIPNLEIGDRGEVKLELWCKGGSGQFSVAGSTVVFVAGVMDQRTCSPAQVAADDALLAELGEATSWSRQGDSLSLMGRKTLRFYLNSN